VIKYLRHPGKREARRCWPIMAYCGPNGGGKSAAAVWDSIPTLELGRSVLSTVRLLDYENPRPCEGCDDTGHDQVGGHLQAHPLWVPFTDWSQLLEAERCDVIMDEVTGVASSRDSQSMPSVVANFLVQLRRRDVVLRWTAPNWARADKIIRECTQAVTYCTGSFAVASRDEQGQRQWRNRRLFLWKTYDANEFEDFTVGKRESMKSLTGDLYWGPKSPAFAAYDSFDSVMSIGTVSDSGRCAHCGGRRTAPACSCPDYQTRKRVTRKAAPEEGPPKGDTAGAASSVPEPSLIAALEEVGS
jgi:Zonular occludens toxin (Zot)